MGLPDHDDRDGSRPRVQVISRVGQILRVLSQEPAGLPLADVVNRTDLPKSTVYRMLLALETEQLVETVDGRFRIGRALNGGGVSWYGELRRRARPLMERMAAQVHETVDLGVLVGDRVMFVEQVRWERELTAGAILGELYPAHVSACGKALLAASPEHRAATLARPLERLTNDTITDPARLGHVLDIAREEMLAYDRDEFHNGIGGLATYARTRNGNPIALGIVVLTARLDAKLPALRELLLSVQREFQRAVETL